MAMQQSSPSPSYNAAWMLAAMCLMILSVTYSLSPPSAMQGKDIPSYSAAQDLATMLNQTLVLAFSRVIMMQVIRSECLHLSFFVLH